MKLNTDRLNAFYQAACDKHFSQAAHNLGITQSALSQRVSKLEQETGTTLFVRSTEGIKLTEAGNLLFNYVQDIELREEKLFETMTGKSDQISGTLRVGSFSSLLRSVVLPSLTYLSKNSSEIYVEFFSRELRELPTMLESGEVDFIILDDSLSQKNFASLPIGEEELVHIRHIHHTPSVHSHEPPIFLDHDAEDMTTYNFFTEQGQPDIEIQRRFYDDVYGLLDGVRYGYGEAIVSKHIIPSDFPVTIVKYSKKILSPVVIYFRENRYQSSLQKKAIQLLQENAPQYLTRHS